MSHRNKQSQHSKRHEMFKVSSLTEECLNNLRKGTSTPKTHLLGFMSQFIQDEQQIKVQQVDELCCYDRMKKILIKNEDSKQQRKKQQITLNKAMQIQSKMNQLQKDLQNKIIIKNKSSSKLLEFRNKNDNKSKTQHFSFKSTMIDDLKQKGYQKFFQFQKIKKQNSISKIKTIIGEEIQSKFKKVVNQKDTHYRKLTDENKILQRKILQKNVELQTLRSQSIYLKQYIKQLQQRLFGANNQLQNTHLIASYQKWISEYKQQFGQMSIKQLSTYIQNIKSKCLQKFDLLQNKNEQKLKQVKKINIEKECLLKKQIQKLEGRENQLIEVNKNLKLNKQISELEINELIRSKQQLKTLRQLILSLYNQWYSKRTQNQKQLMKDFGKLKQNYSYEQMLQYKVFYDNKISTNNKLNQYILKILRCVQKIRRLIFPMQSNQKLDPFLVLDKIQNWVSNRLRQKNRFNQRNVKIDPLKQAKNQIQNFKFLA